MLCLPVRALSWFGRSVFALGDIGSMYTKLSSTPFDAELKFRRGGEILEIRDRGAGVRAIKTPSTHIGGRVGVRRLGIVSRGGGQKFKSQQD